MAGTLENCLENIVQNEIFYLSVFFHLNLKQQVFSAFKIFKNY